MPCPAPALRTGRCGGQKIARAYSEPGGQLLNDHDRWISGATFYIAHIGPMNSRLFGKSFLTEAFQMAIMPDVPAEACAYIHRAT